MVLLLGEDIKYIKLKHFLQKMIVTKDSAAFLDRMFYQPNSKTKDFYTSCGALPCLPTHVPGPLLHPAPLAVLGRPTLPGMGLLVVWSNNEKDDFLFMSS